MEGFADPGFNWRELATNICDVSRTCELACRVRNAGLSCVGEQDSIGVSRQIFAHCLASAFNNNGVEIDQVHVNTMKEIVLAMFASLPPHGECGNEPDRILDVYRMNMSVLDKYMKVLSSVSFLFEGGTSRRGFIALLLHEIHNNLHPLLSGVSDAKTILQSHHRIRSFLGQIYNSLSDDTNSQAKDVSFASIKGQVEFDCHQADVEIGFSYIDTPESLSIPKSLIVAAILNFARGALSHGAKRVDVIFNNGRMYLCSDLQTPWVDSAGFAEILESKDQGIVSGGQGYVYSDQAIGAVLGRFSGDHALHLESPVPVEIVGQCNYSPLFTVSVDLN